MPSFLSYILSRTRKCFLCKMNIPSGTGLTKSVFVCGYTTIQGRIFCSPEHLEQYEHAIKKATKNYVPGCRTCFGG